MSRTDHHRPWQIRAADRVGVKGNDPAYFWHDDHWWHQNRGQCTPRCGWTLPHVVLCPPPRWFRREVWFGPERRRERMDLARLAGEYNTFGDLADDDFPNFQTHHQASYLWS